MSKKMVGIRGFFQVVAVLAVGGLTASGCALLPAGSDEAATDAPTTTAVAPTPTVEPADADWNLSVNGLGMAVGDTRAFDCAPGGQLVSTWGTGTYTSDSSICSAAVHAGVITTASGGVVTVLVTEGLEEYESSDANGVSSSSWGSYDLSFQVS